MRLHDKKAATLTTTAGVHRMLEQESDSFQKGQSIRHLETSLTLCSIRLIPVALRDVSGAGAGCRTERFC